MNITFVFILFLTHLACGLLITLLFLPEAGIDRRFFKSISFWSFLFLASALLLERHYAFSLPLPFKVSQGRFAQPSTELLNIANILGVTLAATCFLFWMFARWGSLRLFIVIRFAGLLALGLLCVEALIYRPQLNPLWVSTINLPLNFISSALLLGSFLAGMIFGHWYLIDTEMPKKLLLQMAWILIGALALRVLSIAVTLLLYKELVYPETNFMENLISLAGHGIFFWQRVLVGLVIPAIAAVMVWSTARGGSNQSATGIMYVGIAFIFIGELAARYLFLLSAIPL
ncbi:MAG: hypothetical protein HYS22_05790 [Deltaproteobacteria bacterium]|nr:hypothetical protein [Deltaproteobacteria bacterium]